MFFNLEYYYQGTLADNTPCKWICVNRIRDQQQKEVKVKSKLNHIFESPDRTVEYR